MRLAGWNYSMPGAYFVTICTYQREPVLACGAVADVVRREWFAIPTRFPSVELDEFVVMPNHLHGIIVISFTGAVGAQRAGAPTGGPTLGKIMRAFKSLSAIEANRALGRAQRPFWQRNYWEHVVRDDDDLNRVRQYIIDNPVKWAEDPENPANLT